jgi:hypothetical protein
MAAYEHRKRSYDIFRGTGRTTITSRNTGGLISSSQRECVIRGKQETISRDNPDWGTMRYIRKMAREGQIPKNRFDSLRRRDIGGSFYSVKQSSYHSHPWVIAENVRAIGGIRRYVGPQFARSSQMDGDNANWPKPYDEELLHLEMLSKGATAISKTIPTNPLSGAAQTLGELKERLPSVPGSRLVGVRGNSAQKLADEYLNLEFGLKPMVSDFAKIGSAARRSRKTLEQLNRDSGRLVRRRYDFPVEHIVEDPVVVSTNASPHPPLDTYIYDDGTGVLTRQRTETRKFWFSGAYTYYVPQGDSILEQARRAEQSANKLFGHRLNAEVLWELTPWSWAVDWVSNLGDVIHNLSAFSADSLVLRWGYLMAHIVTTDTYTLQGVKYVNSPPQTFVQSFTSETKRRIKATPYGFGLEFDGFTPRQIAIITALGISRGGDPK